MFGKGISKKETFWIWQLPSASYRRAAHGSHTAATRSARDAKIAKAYLREHPEIMDEIEHKVRVAYGLIKEEAPEGTEETAAVPETEGDDE